MTDFPSIPGYPIEHELGRGGMATVYLGIQERLNRRVAVKVLSPVLLADRQFIQRFLREAETAANLHHSNIVPIYDVGCSGDNNYIVMEYLPESLKERIKKGPLEPDKALGVVRQIASGLEYAHSEGFVHRDVKPENIMFRRDGTAVLTDFGIARAVDEATRLTKTGMSVGTPLYMSPEQGRGEKIDGRSDLYSLGVVLYEMLTGRVPYDAENTVGVVIKHIQEPVPELPAHLSRYQPLIDGLLAKARGDRLGSGAELIQLIGEVGAGAAGVAGGMPRGLEREDARLPSAGRTPPSGLRRVRIEEDRKERDTPRIGLGKYGEVASRARRSWVVPVLAGMLVVAVGALLYLVSAGGGRLSESPQKTRSAQAEGVGSGGRASAGQAWREDVTGMEFVWIPAGEFMMGSNAGDSDEKPVHRVRIKQGFWMGKYEVTQGEWRAVMGANPSGFPKGDRYPVERVSWEDAQEFIRRLNSRTGQAFRLPIEAEWEYACRAGTTGEHYEALDEIAWYSGNSGGSTRPAGGKKPNAFGLYDMLGNVWEWCQDWYGGYPSSYMRSPTGPTSGSYRVNRGGSWNGNVQDIRAAGRGNLTPSGRFVNLGFRLARTN